MPDPDAANHAATDTDAVGIFADGFDREPVARVEGIGERTVARSLWPHARLDTARMCLRGRNLPIGIAGGA
jgi:hypothetical protein